MTDARLISYQKKHAHRLTLRVQNYKLAEYYKNRSFINRTFSYVAYI